MLRQVMLDAVTRPGPTHPPPGDVDLGVLGAKHRQAVEPARRGVAHDVRVPDLEVHGHCAHQRPTAPVSRRLPHLTSHLDTPPYHHPRPAGRDEPAHPTPP